MTKRKLAFLSDCPLSRLFCLVPATLFVTHVAKADTVDGSVSIISVPAPAAKNGLLKQARPVRVVDSSSSGIVNVDLDGPSCDLDAANPTDPMRPKDVAGVAFDKIDTDAGTIEVCRSAVTKNPDEPRFEYELGRVLEAAKRYDEAMSDYEKAANAGYAIAMASVGRMHEAGTGVAKNLTTAKDWYQKAVAAGYENSRGDIRRLEQALTAATQPEPAPAPPAVPVAPPAPSNKVQTVSNDSAAILNRLSSHPWFDMEDKSCTIEFEGNSIGYSECSHWRFAGITNSESPSYDVDLFATDGRRFEAKVTFLSGRVSIRGHWSGCAICRVSFGLERYDVRLPPLPPD